MPIGSDLEISLEYISFKDDGIVIICLNRSSGRTNRSYQWGSFSRDLQIWRTSGKVRTSDVHLPLLTSGLCYTLHSLRGTVSYGSCLRKTFSVDPRLSSFVPYSKQPTNGDRIDSCAHFRGRKMKAYRNPQGSSPKVSHLSRHVQTNQTDQILPPGLT